MYTVIDNQTKEVVSENFIFLGKPKKHYDRNYAKVFMAFLDELIEDRAIAGKAVRMLFYMIRHMDYNSLEIKIIPSDAVKDLKITRTTYSVWIRALINRGVIKRINRYTFTLKPYTFARGEMRKAMEIEEFSRN